MKYISCFAILFFLLIAVAAHASDAVVGYVKTTKGKALIVRENKATAARINDKIFRNDVLKTGADSSLGVSFKDDTLIALGSNTELIVSKFNFSPAEGKLEIFIKMLRGSVVYLSGIISKLSPKSSRFSTPVGDICLRGTHFAVRIEAE
ncbi:MAG: FecR domain-containing protein [Syntrophaceae bacterium]